MPSIFSIKLNNPPSKTPYLRQHALARSQIQKAHTDLAGHAAPLDQCHDKVPAVARGARSRLRPARPRAKTARGRARGRWVVGGVGRGGTGMTSLVGLLSCVRRGRGRGRVGQGGGVGGMGGRSMGVAVGIVMMNEIGGNAWGSALWFNLRRV
ncbi:hypothetical protein BC936DRAFT_137737 [Jimgerdemannia flammicorona]|uniref:Uncharacterized protein n=1 Tax=Jimgerdemannia flammicorona TaxID=994334 RepID=A0A433DN09_9FUNG|nr:hypothetical protein BC936DRAFT_137737 [Jimgerdemannia flammicorona]